MERSAPLHASANALQGALHEPSSFDSPLYKRAGRPRAMSGERGSAESLRALSRGLTAASHVVSLLSNKTCPCPITARWHVYPSLDLRSRLRFVR